MDKKANFLALSVFFSTEMWERYGFYVVQSLLALFLSLHLHFDDDTTYRLVGSFTALTYISPIVGGFIADKFLGQKNAVLLGIILLFLSYILLSMASDLDTLLKALTAIALGTGLLKPNISALLGQQFEKNCKHRDSSFIIFYLGITCGIILGTTLPSKLQEAYGWNVCFLSAAVGLFLALLFFSFGMKIVKIKQRKIINGNTLSRLTKATTLMLTSYLTFYLVLKTPKIANIFFLVIAVLAVCLVLKIAMKEQGKQRLQTLSLLLLFIISSFFWAFYFQIFTTLTLFITRVVEPSILGVHFPAPYYIAVQSLGMIIIGLFLAKIIARGQAKRDAYSVGKKFTFAIACVLLSYLVILGLIENTPLPNLLSTWPVLIAYLILSLAELMLSPIGLSAVTNLSSPTVVSTMMGVFFVSLGLGGFLSGQLAKIIAVSDHSLPLEALKNHYSEGFHVFVILLSAVLVLSIFITFMIKRLSKWPV